MGRIAGKGRKNKAAATITVESAFCFPIAFFALYAMLYFILLMHTEFVVYQAMLGVSDRVYRFGTISAYTKFIGNQKIKEVLKNDNKLISEKLEELGTSAVGKLNGYINGFIFDGWIEEYLEDNNRELSLIKGGNKGISTKKSKIYGAKNEAIIRADYTFCFPIRFFGLGEINVSESLKIKGFYGAGWEKTDEFAFDKKDKKEETYVYMTDSGEVYHLYEDCSYIKLNPRAVKIEEIRDLRSSNGNIYYGCEDCTKGGAAPTVYILSYGTRYHNTKDCPNIRRNIKKVTLQDATGEGRKECSKCAERAKPDKKEEVKSD